MWNKECLPFRSTWGRVRSSLVSVLIHVDNCLSNLSVCYFWTLPCRFTFHFLIRLCIFCLCCEVKTYYQLALPHFINIVKKKKKGRNNSHRSKRYIFPQYINKQNNIPFDVHSYYTMVQPPIISGIYHIFA